jgi:hypothetical protein
MRIKILSSTLLFFVFTISTYYVSAQDLSSAEIMKKHDDMMSSKSEKVNIKMELTSKNGAVRTREIFRCAVTDNDKNQSQFIRFIAPADVLGTGFLSIEHTGRDNDSWLYLPVLNKSRRITASNKSDNFMGSDFTYEDIEDEDIPNFSYTLTGSEKVNNHDCYILEAIPANDKKKQESGYNKRVLYIAKDNFNIQKIKYMDKNDEFFKEYTADDERKIEGMPKWRSHKMVMTNLKTGHSTTLYFRNFEIDQTLENDIFTQRYLESGKNPTN